MRNTSRRLLVCPAVGAVLGTFIAHASASFDYNKLLNSLFLILVCILFSFTQANGIFARVALGTIILATAVLSLFINIWIFRFVD
jgi:hypothetical protein